MHSWIDTVKSSTVVLLGAGASQPFVPVSRQLTELVIKSIDEEFTADNDIQKLWRAIRPELDGIGGDIEYLYQTLETLGYQEQDPTRHWITGFKKFGDYEDSSEGRAAFAQHADFLTSIIASRAYRLISEYSECADVNHFYPMLQAPIAGIVSLNYDLLLERAASEYGTPISTGAKEWDGGSSWQFPDGHLPLLKLHGSVNWKFSRAIQPSWQIPRIGIYEMTTAEEVAPNGRVDPKLIFGGGSKFRPDEPWPALYAAFEGLLARAETLVIIGYSFRDRHVDTAIRRWAAQSPSRRIINIDPYPVARPSLFNSSIGDLRYALDPECITEEGVVGLLADTDQSRFELVKTEAVKAIPAVFG